jgi:hypothetical protein
VAQEQPSQPTLPFRDRADRRHGDHSNDGTVGLIDPILGTEDIIANGGTRAILCGRQPRWVSELIEAGKTIEDFRR